MPTKQYDIIFNGEIVDGVDLNVAKHQLAALFKITDEKAEVLFSGKAVTLKRNLPFAMANKYRVAIKKAGSLVDVIENTAAKEPPKTDVPVQAKSVVGATTSSDMPVSDSGINRTDKAEALSVLPVGADLVDSPNHVVAAEVDVSHISVREGQGLLLDESEKEPVAVLEVDISSLTMGEVGADVLSVDERAQPVENTVNISHLALDASDEPLEVSRKVDQPIPDTGHLSLVESH